MAFDYSAYFHRVQDMKKLQVLHGDVSWLERYATPAEEHDTLLYLGCNILRTPHIAKQVVGVFEHLGLDFVAVGGVQYCCGIAWEAQGDRATGQRVSGRTIGRMESYGARRVIMWCPSCNVHFTEIVLGRDGARPDFEITHTPSFLAGLAAGPEGLPWRQEVRRRVVLHAHAGRDGHAEGERRAREDREAVLSLLRAVPGLEVLDVLVSDPEMDYDCGGAQQKLPVERFRGHQRATLERALDLGAEQVVTISHACQREWCGENTGQLGVRNYISVVAEALGLPVEPDVLTMIRDGRSADEIVELSRMAWTSHGMTEDEARAMVQRYVDSGDLTGFSAGVGGAA
jgi:heterodisulfide reductase subunit D